MVIDLSTEIDEERDRAPGNKIRDFKQNDFHNKYSDTHTIFARSIIFVNMFYIFLDEKHKQVSHSVSSLLLHQ